MTAWGFFFTFGFLEDENWTKDIAVIVALGKQETLKELHIIS